MNETTRNGASPAPENGQIIWRTLRDNAQKQPKATALEAPGRAPMSYARLWRHLQQQVSALNALGIGRDDRVGIVLQNGPEMASAFLCISACTCAAPLNPAYTAREFDFYLSDINARAIIVPEGEDSPAVRIAAQKGIPVVRLVTTSDLPAGCFSLRLESKNGNEIGPAKGGLAGPDDVALILHTSGTTSRPKMVPLLQANLFASARNIGRTLRLSSSDRCLNVMPLFHIHGLMAALSASIVAGSSVVCTPGFFATDFFDWLEDHEPTWYTAVPTMHQAILERAPQHADLIRQRPLRFIRSSSASLPPQVLEHLEKTFAAPVVEAYGMTEATHQMASNPLPPGERKLSSVGPAAGPEIAIMDEDGRLLRDEQIGEIAIRGTTVTTGYLENPEANARAFVDGWFRTGDEGYLDRDGYLFITGRIKELINRGGEKISPREIDEVLMDHPAVSQAVAFAIPDAKLGEDVGAAVVRRAGKEVTEQQLRAFAATRLSAFKLPRTFVFLDEIPKGPTGKLQRIGLAEKLGLGGVDGESYKVPFTAPSTPVEEYLARVWTDVLDVKQISVHDEFLSLGGDSMLATRLITRIVDDLAIELSMVDLFNAPTVAEQARIVERILLEEDEARAYNPGPANSSVS